MKIVGDSIQEGIPTPEESKEIEVKPTIEMEIIINGEKMLIPNPEEFKLKEGDFFFKSIKDGKWYLRKEK